MVMEKPQFHIKGGRKYDPVGRCIYCGDTTSRLTDEHVLPYAMAQNALVLPKSSCDQCADVTKRFENDLLRQALGIFRNRIGAPTRNPKDRPSEPRVGVGRREGRGPLENSGEHMEIPISEMPLAYLTLKFRGLPGVLAGRPANGEINWEFWARSWLGEQALKRVSPRREGLHLGSLKPITFARFLAKVAHGYAVAETGGATFEPMLLDLILGRSEEIAFLIGGYPDDREPLSDEFFLQWGWAQNERGAFLVVEIRLYANLGAPTYLVVVGRRP